MLGIKEIDLSHYHYIEDIIAEHGERVPASNSIRLPTLSCVAYLTWCLRANP